MIKSEEKIRELKEELASKSKQGMIIQKYLDAVEKDDIETASQYAPLIEEIDPNIYQASLAWHRARQMNIPMTGFLAGEGAPAEVVTDAFSLEKRGELDDVTIEQGIRDKARRGEELTTEERAILLNMYQKEIGSTDESQTVDPAETFRDSVKEEQKTRTRQASEIGLERLDQMLQEGTITPEEHKSATLNFLDAVEKAETAKDDAPPDFSGMPQTAQSAFRQVQAGDSKTQVEANQQLMKDAVDADLAAGDKNWTQTKGQLKQFAYERAGESEKKWVVGREEMEVSLAELSKQLAVIAQTTEFDTGMLEGTWEQINERLGRTTNPRLARFITELRLAIQAYRQAISGAAFTEAEAKEYERIFPGLSQNMDVNRARIAGLKNNITKRQRAFYERYLGSKENADWVFGMTGDGLVKDGLDEIEKLKTDYMHTRKKDGVRYNVEAEIRALRDLDKYDRKKSKETLIKMFPTLAETKIDELLNKYYR